MECLTRNSCVRFLLNIIGDYNIIVTVDGDIFKILPNYRSQILNLCGLIIIGFIAHIIKNFPYYPITVIENTLYSRIVASTLASHKIPFILCKGNNITSYYGIDNGNQISFEGPNFNFFLNSYNEKIPIIPCSKEDIIKLEQHTGLTNLYNIQNEILSNFDKNNNIYIGNIYDIINTKLHTYNPIIGIKRFIGNLYYIMTTTEIWLSQIIITDTVFHLQPTEIISTINAISVDNASDYYNIYHKSDNICIITEPNVKTQLQRINKYLVNNDLTIKLLFENHSDNVEESPIYNLYNPRPFNYDNLYIIHPFHLPTNWDIILNIMIVTHGLINKIFTMSVKSLL